jgi:hypothetical protein
MPQLCTFGASSARGFGLTEETGPGLPDDQFNLTTLLLPGNGTNGAQNNTFLDSSTNNLTITRNGNTTQGTFSPFSFGGGTAQANGYYSGYFDGTGDYLNVSYLASNFGTGDFTLELFVYLTKYDGDGNTIIDTRASATANPFVFGVLSNGLAYYYNGTSYSSSTVVPLNSWVHLAICRSGTTLKIFQNGVETLSRTDSSNLTGTSTGSVTIARATQGIAYINGYLSNFRIVKGTAVYTANFTVPTTPLTAISGTSLLTCQSSQFIDNSTNAFAITVNGNSQPVPTNPFGMTDWSGYFDGTGDYLTATNASAFAFGTGDFTCELWCYLNSGTNNGLFQIASSVFPGVSGLAVSLVTNQLNIYYGASSQAYPFGNMSAGTWNHVALVRQSGALYVYLNGVRFTVVASDTTNYTGTTVVIGGYYSTSNLWNGSISNFRIVKGTAVYTSNFTPPTAPLTAISGTSLLTCQSSTFIDNSPNAFTITVNGNPYTLTLNNPFNSPVNYTTPPLQAWSNYFDGTGDYLSFSPGSAFAFGTGDFSVECWVYPTVTLTGTSSLYLIDARNAGQTGTWAFATNANGSASPMRLDWYTGSAVVTGSSNLIVNTWNHCVYSRSASTYGLFLNGTRIATGADSTNYSVSPTTSYIAARFSAENALTGYLSNIRTVKGTAVYDPAQSTITVPTSPLSAVANTGLLTCQSNRFVDNSINRLAITRNGDTSVQPFSPFQPAVPYSTTSVGGSGFFGVGNYFSLANNTALTMGASDFTMEAWAYPTAFGAYDLPLVVHRPIVSANGIVWGLALTTGVPFLLAGDSNTSAWNITLTGSTAATLNAWNHVALTRNGSTWTLWLNGASVASGSASFTMEDTGTLFVYGADVTPTAAPFTGYSAGFRMVKGTSLYNTNFVPPTSPPTAVTNTSLLLNFTNAGIPDATGKGDWETVGNTQISTAQSKFGGSSMYFDGSGDRLINLASSQYSLFDFGTGDFTIEFWFYCINTTSGIVYARGASSHNLCVVYLGANATDKVSFYGAASGAGTAIKSAGTPAVSTWNHAAIVRQNGTVTVYLNGTGGTPTSNTTNITNSSYVPSIGDYNHSPLPFAGYLDDFRITKGYARYTTNFTPPTSAFPLI